ncbi:MAG: hypothetical protein ACI9RP_002057 [Cyclobacteriaceae bacterium]|jgi:hypothetical protein
MTEGGNMGDNFEKNWKEVFSKMSEEPNPKVWEGVDRTLANTEVVYYRKKAHVYKWAAIIAILFAVTISVPGYFTSETDGQLALSKEETAVNKSIPVLTKTEVLPISRSVQIIDRTSEEIENFGAVQKRSVEPILLQKKSLVGDEILISSTGNGNRNSILIAFIEESSFAKKQQILDYSYNTDVSEKRIYAKPNAYNLLRKQDFTKKALWAGVGFGSSAFDPSYQLIQPGEVVTSVLSAPSSFQNDTDVIGQQISFNEDQSQGVNYQLGFNFGMEITTRISLEGGFTYAEAQLTTQAQQITENRLLARSISQPQDFNSQTDQDFASAREDIVEYTSTDISLRNNFQFASIPLRAGIEILDRRFSVRVNAGLTTNFYLGNTVSGDQDAFPTLDVNPGEESPYRTVSFSGVTGVSLGYNLFDRFDLMVEPNYAHALQPLTKGESNFNAAPSGFGMIAGLRYRFNR